MGGLVGIYYEKEEVTTECYSLLGCYDFSEYSYPYVIPGAIAVVGGLYVWYKGTLEKLKPVAPYESAAAIAEEFNKDLIERIQKYLGSLKSPIISVNSFDLLISLPKHSIV